MAAARRTTGRVLALDIDDAMVAATAARALGGGIRNVDVRKRDFVARGTGLAAESTDFAMLFNILHGDDPLPLLREAFRVLRAGGRAAVTHWIPDASTPRGPDLAIRPRPERVAGWLQQAGFELIDPLVELPPYHFGVVARKRVSGHSR